MNNSSIVIKNVNKILAFCLIVLCLAIACSLAAISGSNSFTDTYKVGKVCDVSGNSIVMNNETGFESYIYTQEEPFEWKYVYLNICEADFNNKEITVQAINGGDIVNETTVNVVKGNNLIELKGAEYDSIKLLSLNKENILFTTKYTQFREEKMFFSMADYLINVFLFGMAFSVIGVLIIIIYRKKGWHVDWYAPIEFLQEVYISFGNRLLPVSQKYSHRLKSILRVMAFVCWMYWIMLMYNTGKYLLSSYFKYNVLIFVVVLLLIAISMLEKPLEKKNWNLPLVHAWFWLSICMCVSEFFVSKRFCMIGYVNLTAFGFYYFVWANSMSRRQLVNELILSFKIAFLISVCFTLLFRPRVELYGLVGHTWNPNIYGIFCGIALLAFLETIRNNLVGNKYSISLWVNMAGGTVALSFVLLSGSRAGILIILPGLLFMLIEYISYLRKNSRARIKGIIAVPIILTAFMVCHVFLSWATVHLPIKEIVFSWDSYIPNEITNSMIVIGMENSSLYDVAFNQKLTKFLTSRNYYWMGYLREINFFGHEYYPIMWGCARTPHNGILGIVYRYGIIAAVPYVMMFVNAVITSFKMYLRNRDKKNYSFFLWICVIGISLCMLIENFERPFLATEWLCWYWCLGFLFSEKFSEDI